MSSVSLIDGHIDEMTDKEIIKALECCLDTSPLTCKNCPLFNVKNSTMVCSKSLTKFSIDLITRQRAEIEQRKEEANKYQKIWLMAVDGIETAKFKAIKEFSERLNKELSFGHYIHPDQIDNLVKEMVGERK